MHIRRELRKLFFHYVRDIRWLLAGWMTSLLMALLLFWLYHAPVSAISYTFMVCFLGGTIFLTGGFYQYVRAWEQRQRIREAPEFFQDETDTGHSSVEEEYWEILQDVIEKKRKELEAMGQRQQEQQDYVMLWAHQIKTPITAMNLLLQSEESVDRDALIQELREMDGYVDTMLQYVRLDSVNADLVLDCYALDTLVKPVVRYFSKTFITKRLSIHLENLEYPVKTDEKWMVFVLKQILSNALKYTEQGGISIYGRRETEGSVRLVIEDTGCGIAPEDLPRIFEKAFTGYNGHMEKKATGIGLFLSRKILSRLGHTISVESEEGIGTKVILGFPCMPENEVSE